MGTELEVYSSNLDKGYKYIRIVQHRSKIVMISKDGKTWVSLNEGIGVEGDFDVIYKLAPTYTSEES